MMSAAVWGSFPLALEPRLKRRQANTHATTTTIRAAPAAAPATTPTGVLLLAGGACSRETINGEGEGKREGNGEGEGGGERVGERTGEMEESDGDLTVGGADPGKGGHPF